MPDLRLQLHALRDGPTLWIGVGSPEHADDAAGLVLAQLLIDSAIPHVAIAGANPERWIASADFVPFRQVVFLDAVELGAEPGAVAFLAADEIATRFPQITTHKISLGLLARYIEAQAETRASLLAIQPLSLQPKLPVPRSPFNVQRSTFNVRRSAFPVQSSAMGDWLSAIGHAHPPAISTPAQPSPPSPHPRLTLAPYRDGERAGVRGTLPANVESPPSANTQPSARDDQEPVSVLSPTVQLTVELLHQLIVESLRPQPSALDRMP